MKRKRAPKRTGSKAAGPPPPRARIEIGGVLLLLGLGAVGFGLLRRYVYPPEKAPPVAPAAAPVPPPEVSLACGQEAGLHIGCSRADDLRFRVSGVRAITYLAAYAEPLADAGVANAADRRWLFPTSARPALRLAPGKEPELVGPPIELGTVPPGRYQIIIVLSPAPLDRGAVLGARAPLRAQLEVFRD